MSGKKFTFSTFLMLILILIGLLFVLPWISFWLAYLGGWIAAKVIGTKIVEGLAILGIMIPISKIPLLAGMGEHSTFIVSNEAKLSTKKLFTFAES